MGSDNFHPVVIIGAPRSGTNMLRDILTACAGASTWPCDEINYIWRHGNLLYPSDEFTADMATSRVRSYIRKQFSRVARTYDSPTVVEKTCANSLRVAFVDAILPEAKYIYIFRDGIDATGSAKLRWKSALDIPYLLKKVRFVPWRDLPYYAARFAWSRLYRLSSKEKRLAFWGPVLDDMDAVLRHNSLTEVCALQWQRCVENAELAFSDIASERVHRVCYEDFVDNADNELRLILEFLGVSANEDQIKRAVSTVSGRSVGKGRAALGHEEIARLEFLIGATLDRYGYRG